MDQRGFEMRIPRFRATVVAMLITLAWVSFARTSDHEVDRVVLEIQGLV